METKLSLQQMRKLEKNLAEIERLLQIPKPPYDLHKLSSAVIAYLTLDPQQITLLLMLDLSATYACVEPKAETDEQKVAALEKVIKILQKTETKSSPSGGSQIQITVSDPTDAKIYTLIQNTIQKTVYRTNEKWFSFEVVTSPQDHEIIAKFEGAKESLRNNIKDMLRCYPENYFRFSGDLKASDIIYEDINSSWIERLIVTGTFYCDKNNKIFPAKVDTLDCHGLGKDYITRDTKLPKARVVNCDSSITNFGVFMRPDEKDPSKLVRTLPAEVKILIVEPSLIRKENFEVNEQFENITKFKNIYGTTITVQDPKGNTLENNLKEYIFGIIKPTNSTTISTQILKEKRKGEQLDRIDLYKICMSTQQYNDYVDYLLDFIDQALSYIGYNGKVKAICSDGKEGYCIDFTETNIKLFLKNLDEVIEQRMNQYTKETPRAKKQVVKPQQNEKTTEVTHKIKIVKYIQQDVFSAIASDENPDFAMQVLRDIESVNIDPSDPQITNGTPLQTTPTTKVTKSGGCYITQTNKKAKTIIWLVAQNEKGEKIFVCKGFFKKNTKSKQLVVEGSRKLQTFTNDMLKDYITVSSLIEFYNSPKPGSLIRQHFGITH